MELFKLVGSIFVDNEKANESLAKTDEQAQKTGLSLGEIAGTAAKVGTAVVAGATAAVTGITAMATSAASAADEIDKGSIRMGVSTDYYQELAYAAGQSGIEMSTLEKAAKKLEGTDLTLDEALAQIMALGTAEERAAAASETFGDSLAYTLSPMLQQTGEEFNDMLTRADDLGLVMSEESVAAGVKLGDTMSDVTQSFKALGTRLATSVMPVVQKFADRILDFMPKIISMVDMIAPMLMTLFEQLVPPLMELAEALLPIIFNLIEALLPPIIQLATALLPVVVQVLDAMLPILQPLLDVLTPIIAFLVQLIQTILPPLVNFLSGALKLAITALGSVIQGVAGEFKAAWDTIVNLWNGAGAFFQGIWDGIKGAFGAVADWFRNIFSTAWEAVKNVFSTGGKIFDGIKEGIASTFKTVVNGLIGGINKVVSVPFNAINAALDGLRNIDILGLKPFSWLASIATPQIPLLASGGEANSSGSAIVGEQGPELIDMPEGASVIPLRDSSISTGIEALNEKLNRVILLLSGIAKDRPEYAVVLDSGALVGELTPEIDRALGEIAKNRLRRV